MPATRAGGDQTRKPADVPIVAPGAATLQRPGARPQSPRPVGARQASAADGALTARAIETALAEIATIPAARLHQDAAYCWAARAIACYRVSRAKTAVQEGLSYLYLGEHYREAALAHAILGESWGPMYDEVTSLMEDDRKPAAAALRRRSKAQAAAGTA